MKLFQKYKYIMAMSLLAGTWACEVEEIHSPYSDSGKAPGMVYETTVENLPGKAKISYALPDDGDLLYVKAEFERSNGKTAEVKSSYYNNSLMVEGFADTEEHEVKLYAVNRAQQESEPVTVTIKPEKAPLWDVYESMEVKASFGGIQVDALNPNREDVAILIMEQNEYGEWVADPNSIYTSTDSIDYALRGMDTLKHEFAFTVRDRWLNYTDTVFSDIYPLYESALPKSNYRGVHLPGDAPHHPSTSMAGMWDGEIMNWPAIYMTQSIISGPHTITIDTGVEAKMSRIVIWDYPEYFNGRTYYYLGNLKKFEVWGSNDPPSDGSYDNWVKLGTYNATKPSGLPFGQQSDEDYRVAVEGFNWEFDIDAPKVRYLRIRSIQNWGGSSYMAIGEIQVYGDPR
ncbi:DUF4959 domain-containing protein [Echinicola jeungdonensis]|uniref:DUF5000 domain-containing lipoprotein n=1 Tax=Echinicola jeungdonensis TaxID=709343 RepID=A0ABV5J2X1_9BACT|nr:DUF5000 domain-containing lipoprotein [Echinicola jeungdonensis]MDN3668494.1 DUF4959 domain-containing protein [Echinicola jeungdonensis]